MLSLMATVFPRTSFSSPPNWSNMVVIVGSHPGPYSRHIAHRHAAGGSGIRQKRKRPGHQQPAAVAPMAPRNFLREQGWVIGDYTSISNPQQTFRVGSPKSVPGGAATPLMVAGSGAPDCQNRAARARVFTQRVMYWAGAEE